MHSILAVTDAPFTQAPALLFFHLLGLILYVGGFLALSRWLAKAVRFESADARTEAYRVLKRMHRFVDWPGLGIVVITATLAAIALQSFEVYHKSVMAAVGHSASASVQIAEKAFSYAAWMAERTDFPAASSSRRRS